MTELRKAKPLKKGDLIGIIAPASPQHNQSKLEAGIRYLEGLGYRIEVTNLALKKFDDYLAGTDQERANDLQRMFERKDISAIFCARGGYGTMRILDLIDYKLISRNPKIFVGFSDTTALQSVLFKRARLVTFMGAMPGVDFSEFDAESEEMFWRCLTSTKPLGEVNQSEPLEILCKGIANGPLICGNLSLFAAMCGSSYLPSLRDSILLIEDIGEDPYRIDRMLMQLELNGWWKKLSGLCFGRFTQENLRPTSHPSRDMDDVVRDFARRSRLPALGNILFGHQAKKLTLYELRNMKCNIFLWKAIF